MTSKRTGARKGASDTCQRPTTRLAYNIPAIWDCWGYEGLTKRRSSQLAIDLRSYLASCLQWIDHVSQAKGSVTGKSLSRIKKIRPAGNNKVKDQTRTRRSGDWIRTQTLYGMMIRAATAWDHDGNGSLSARSINEMGTFLKTVLLLPHLRRMGATVLYLLPISKVSNLYRKGELGCPYSAKNFFELDGAQFEPALADTYGDINDQFRVLVDSAHRLGMRVMLDIAPRTASRDSDWILDNPEWFYWIDRRFEKKYGSPHIPNVDYINAVPGRLNEIYEVPEVRKHLKKFRFAPNVTAPGKWSNFVRQAKKRPPTNLLKEIATHFGVVTPPGFSDCVNDPQPPWSDVTYLRMFMDHPTEATRYLENPHKQPPYVLFDTAKASNFSGRIPNTGLWNKLSQIIPFYQQYGVDGARIDMAHALPKPLERMILDKPRQRDPDFCFLAEELGTHLHAKAYAGGYNIIIGPSWYMQSRGHEGLVHELVKCTYSLKVPVMAAAETPDTPRAAVRRGARKFSRQAVVMNHFLPNAVPMIHCGMEVFERQPVNLGLDSSEKNRFALPKGDPFYGKLAFFDRFAIHWDNTGGKALVETIGKAATVRKQFIKRLTSKRAYFAPKLGINAKHILATGFTLGKGKGSLLMLANLDYKTARRTTVAVPGAKSVDVLLRICESADPKVVRGKLQATLEPGEVLVVRA